MTELPVGWRLLRLGDVLAEPLVNGRSVPTADEGFPVLRLTALGDGHVDLTQQKIGAWTADEARRFLVEGGDFLVARGNGSLRLVGQGGLVGLIDSPVAFPDTMIRIRPAVEMMDPTYMALVWSSEGVRTQIERAAKTTAGIYKVNQKDLSSVLVPVPPLDEQQRIVNILEDHLSRLDAGNLGLRTVDSLTATFRRSSLNKAIHSVPTLMKPLGSVLERIEAGKSFTCLPRPSEQGEWGVVKVSAMTWGEFRPSENKAVPPGRSVDPRYEIREGDILVSRANTENYVGAPVIVEQQPDRLLLSDKSLRLVPGHDVDRDWLITVLSAPATRSQISSMATGTKDSMRNISQKTLLSVTIPVPDLASDQVVVAEMAAVLRLSSERLAKVAYTAEAKGKALRRSLLAAAFSGRLCSDGMELSSV